MQKTLHKLLFVLALSLVVSVQAASSYSKMNKAMGVNIFGSGAFFHDSIQDLARRLYAHQIMLNIDSDQKTGRYSGYVRGNRACLGGTLNQIVVRTEKDMVRQVDLVMVNKGDSAGQNSAKDMDALIKKETKAVQKSLSGLLGEPSKGATRTAGVSSSVLWWRLGNTAFVLKSSAGEYVMVSIMPTKDLQNTESRKDARQAVEEASLTKNVVKKTGGDVWIGNIPMVNQGGKGYCGPATLERIFQYYGITSITMHTIAEDAETAQGGGTSVPALIKTAAYWGRRVGLSVKSYQLSFKNIKKCVDAGIPMCWVMYSHEPYVQRMVTSTQKREKMGKTEWKKELDKMAPLPDLKQDGHICLIIGYNERTNEIGVSNSWGGANTPTWVRFVDLQRVSVDREIVVLKR